MEKSCFLWANSTNSPCDQHQILPSNGFLFFHPERVLLTRTVVFYWFYRFDKKIQSAIQSIWDNSRSVLKTFHLTNSQPPKRFTDSGDSPKLSCSCSAHLSCWRVYFLQVDLKFVMEKKAGECFVAGRQRERNNIHLTSEWIIVLSTKQMVSTANPLCFSLTWILWNLHTAIVVWCACSLD